MGISWALVGLSRRGASESDMSDALTARRSRSRFLLHVTSVYAHRWIRGSSTLFRGNEKENEYCRRIVHRLLHVDMFLSRLLSKTGGNYCVSSLAVCDVEHSVGVQSVPRVIRSCNKVDRPKKTIDFWETEVGAGCYKRGARKRKDYIYMMSGECEEARWRYR